MKATRFHKTGAPEVLIYEDVPDPVPGPGQILLKVEAAGVNYVDIMRRRGDPLHEPTPLPFILGYEMAGTVVKLGAGVTSPAPGSRVFVNARSGAYAQYAIAPAESALEIPAGLDAIKIVALWLQGLTAALSLKYAGRLEKGETVLIEAAGGGVGTLAVQLAKLYGAGKVIAAASADEKLEVARRLGADVGINYRDSGWVRKTWEATGGKGVDVVLESVGGTIFEQALETLAPFGRQVVIGSASNRPSTIASGSLFNHNRAIVGFGIHQYYPKPGLIQSTLEELVGHVVAGRLVLQLDHVLPLSEAAAAHRLVEERKSTGKVVLTPW
jgi:NADPH2:quinone reductase